MTTKLVKINAADYGLEETKAAQISEMFKPMLDKMVELEKEYNEVVQLETSRETCVKAKMLRLKYVKVRTGVVKIHKDLKSFYLRGGRFVDGWKNAQLMASQGIEEKLKDMEEHYNNLEKKRVEELHNERANKLHAFEVEVIPEGLGLMAESVWDNFLAGIMTNYETRKQAEIKAEEERRERERIIKLHDFRKNQALSCWQFIRDDIKSSRLGEMDEGTWKNILSMAQAKKKRYEVEQERIRKENERLKQEAETAEKKRKQEEVDRQAKAETERKERERIVVEEKTKAEVERKAREERERKEREAYEAKLKKERKERERIEAELKARAETERKEKERIAAELKAKEEKEKHRIEEAQRREREQKEVEERKKQEAQEAEARKGDEEKVKDLILELEIIKGKYTFKSKKNLKMFRDVQDLIDKIINHIN